MPLTLAAASSTCTPCGVSDTSRCYSPTIILAVPPGKNTSRFSSPRTQGAHLHQALVFGPQPPRVRLLGALNLALQRLDVAAGGVQRLLPQVDCGVRRRGGQWRGCELG